MDKFDAHKRTVKEIFSYIYEIPFYQRGYSWKEEQVAQFWDDLLMVLHENHGEYFLGSVVLNGENSASSQVIDGQQRLTTVTIFLCVVRDLLIEKGITDPSSTIHSLFISQRDIYGRDKFKLTLSEENKEFFKEYIQTPIDVPGRKGQTDFDQIPPNRKRVSNSLLWEAHNYFKKSLISYLDENNNDITSMLSLVEIITEKFLIISITVSSDSDAYIIFETLNDRGMDLSTADLLKNYLFSKAEREEVSIVQESWKEMSVTLNQINITPFLRYFWLAKHERVTDKKLYEKIKTYVSRPSVNVGRFVRDLSESADVFVNISNPTADAWSDRTVLESLENINTLNYKAAYPVILIGKSRLSPSNFKAVVLACEYFMFKYTTICGNSPSDVEKIFSTITKEIRDNGDSSMSEVFAILTRHEPPDDRFMEDFQSKSINTQKVQRYILEKIDFSMGTGELIANHPHEVHVEHIIPRRPNEHWQGILQVYEENHEDYVNRIGNLTLLSHKLNQPASNRDFMTKKTNYYSASEFLITQQLLDFDEFVFSTVEERQERLAQIACSIWKISRPRVVTG